MNGESTGTLMPVVALLIIVFGVFLYLFIFKRGRNKGQEMLQSIGFAAIAADKTLERRLAQLYHNPNVILREVFQRRLPDASMYIFALDDPDGLVTPRGIAILSSNLSLPQFRIFPKIDSQQFGLGGLGNKVLERAVATAGEKVEFPAFPEFAEKYFLVSDDQESVLRFFNERMADYFSRTQLFSVLAEGDMFVFEDYGMFFVKNDLSTISQSVRRAMEIYEVFQT